MKKTYLLLMFSIVVLLFTSCNSNNKEIQLKETMSNETTTAYNEIENNSEELDPEIIPKPAQDVVHTVSLGTVGDIMVHKPQLQRAYNQSNDSFDFTSSFELIKPFLEQSDFMSGNLETTLSGKDEGIQPRNSDYVYYQGYQGYPYFNSPEVLASNLKEAGFDFLNTANNHSMDGWTGGLQNTIDELDKIGLEHVGTNKNSYDPNFVIKEINNIKFGFFSYTYATNGINPHEEDEYMINSLKMNNNYEFDQAELDRMYNEIQHAKIDNDLDVAVVYMHFGYEYYIYPNDDQKRIVDGLFNAGADIIFGSHPHVLQPMEIRDIVQDDGSVKKGVLIYSLGNFLSSQIYLENEKVPKDCGVLLNVDISKLNDEDAKITGIKLLPTWVQWTDKSIRVIPVDDALEKYNKNNSYNLTEKAYNRLKDVKKFSLNHIIGNNNLEIQKKNQFYCISFQELY